MATIRPKDRSINLKKVVSYPFGSKMLKRRKSIVFYGHNLSDTLANN